MMRLTKMFKQPTLRQKMIWTSMICLIVPVSVILLTGSMFTKDLIKEQAIGNASAAMKVARSLVAGNIKEMIGAANAIQFDSETTSFLRNPDHFERHYDQIVRITNKLAELSANRTDLYISLVTNDRRYYTNYAFSEYDPLQFLEQPWMEELAGLSAYDTLWLGVHRSYMRTAHAEDDDYMITIARALRANTLSPPYGYIIVSMDEKAFSGIFANYEDQNFMLLSADGVVMSGSGDVGTQFPHFNQWDEISAEPIISISGEPYLHIGERLPYGDWQLVSLIPYKDAVSRINHIYQTNFIWQIAFFILFLVILIYLLRQFTKPIVQLGDVASSVIDGNLSLRSNIRGGDELGRLGKSFDHMLDSIEEMVSQITIEQERKRKAELSMLQAQIHPHFLFNILNSIRMRILLRGDRENAELLRSLNKLLRMSIQRQDELIALQDEAAVTEKYMQLMQFTLKDPFRYEVKLNPRTLYAKVPRFILQPVIENALNHGLRQRSGKVELSSALAGDNLVIVIADNGCGMTAEQLEEMKRQMRTMQTDHAAGHSTRLSGIGLANVYDRLRMIYGDKSGIEVVSDENIGTTVSITLPMEEEEQPC